MPTCIAIILVYIYNAYLQIEGYFNQNSLMNVPYNLIQIAFIAIGFDVRQTHTILQLVYLENPLDNLFYLRVLIKKKNDFRHRTRFKSSRYKYQANVNTGGAGIYHTGCKSA